MTRVRAIEILRPGPPGEGMDPGQVAEIEAAIGRAIPSTDPPSSAKAYVESISGIKRWTKRRYVLAEEDHQSGGVVDVAGAITAGAGNDVVFDPDPDLDYLIPSTGLTIGSNTRITSRGSRKASLTAPSSASGTGLINLGFATNVTIEGLDIDLGSHATMTQAIRQSANTSTYRGTRINDVTVRNAAGAGLYFWRALGIILERVEVLDSVRGIEIGSVDGHVVIDKPRIISAVSGRMQYGIRTSSGSADEGVGLEILSPYISGANATSPTGTVAHGISIWRTRGAKIVGGTITNFGDASSRQGGGVCFLGQSYYGQVIGTHIHDAPAIGIWAEIFPSADVTLGSDTAKRGVSITGVRAERTLGAVNVSYGAGTHITDTWAIESARSGFVTDSEAVTHIGCKVVNPWTALADLDPEDDAAAIEAMRPGQNDGVFAGFRAYGGSGFRNKYSGGYFQCEVIDNRTVPLVEYGFAAEDRGYRFVGNMADGTEGGYYGGTSNNRFDGMNSWE